MLSIVTIPNSILKTPASELSAQNILLPEMQSFISEMIPTMYTAKGIGLAAPQVDKSVMVCVIGKEADPLLKQDLILINPTWKKLSRKKIKDGEGCLSVPNIFGDVVRWKDIEVRALDFQGRPLLFTAHNFFARVIQHEVDHLNGVLFVEKAENMYRVLGEEQTEAVRLKDLIV